MSERPLSHTGFHTGKELPVLWENRHFIVINKPAGLASHPGPRTADSVETRLIPQKRGGPWLVHRLDRDTSGCLLIARRKTALIAAQQAFANRQVRKSYWALVQGTLPALQGEITAPLKRIKVHNGWKVQTAPKNDQDAQKAHTIWRVMGQTETCSWVELDLLTGRTHQARVHLASLGTPILGDPVYGPSLPEKSGQPASLQLLSRSLDLELPFEETLIKALAPPPPEMAALLKQFG